MYPHSSAPEPGAPDAFALRRAEGGHVNGFGNGVRFCLLVFPLVCYLQDPFLLIQALHSALLCACCTLTPLWVFGEVQGVLAFLCVTEV